MSTATPSTGRGRPVGANQVGTVVGVAGLSVEECGGDGIVRMTKFTLTNLAMTMAEINGTDAGWGSQKLYDFPLGRISILSCVTSLAFTTTSILADTLNASSTCSVGVGSVAATAGCTGTLATTMMDFMPGSGEAVKAFTSSATINVAGANSTGWLANVAVAKLAAQFNGTVTALDAFLNIAAPTANDIDADATLTVSGSIYITWLLEGTV